MPDMRGAVILGADGQPFARGTRDGSAEPVQGRYDEFAAPHGLTFAGIITSASRSYFHYFDEAMRHSRENALAMRREPFIRRLLRERRDAVISLRWHLEPDNKRDPYQVVVADGLTRHLRGTRHLLRAQRYLHEATWFGRGGPQVRWDYEWDQVDHLRCLKAQQFLPTNGDKIGFGLDHVPYVLVNYAEAERQCPGAEFVNTTAGGRGLRLVGEWRERWVIHQFEPEDADFWDWEFSAGVHGVGVRNVLYWSWWLVNEYVSWVVDTLERIGLGLVIVEYDQSNQLARNEAEQLAKQFSRRSVITVPVPKDRLGGVAGGGSVRVVESPTAGALVLLQLRQHVEDHVERYVVGQTMSSDHRGSGGLGGSGAAQFQQDTKYRLISGDALDYAETLTGSTAEPGLVSTMMAHTYPWAEFPPPRWTYEVDRPDPAGAVTAAKTLVEMGIPVVVEEVRGLAGLSDPTPDDEVVGAPQTLAGAGQGGAPPGQDGGYQPITDEEIDGPAGESQGSTAGPGERPSPPKPEGKP